MGLDRDSLIASYAASEARVSDFRDDADIDPDCDCRTVAAKTRTFVWAMIIAHDLRAPAVASEIAQELRFTYTPDAIREACGVDIPHRFDRAYERTVNGVGSDSFVPEWADSAANLLDYLKAIEEEASASR